MSVTTLTAIYLVYTLKTKAFYGVFKICIVCISLKMLCSKVLATFADHLCLLCYLTSSPWTKETAMALLVCRCNDSSYNSTDSTLIIVGYQLRFLPLAFFVRTKSADLAYTWYTEAYYIIACNWHSCGYSIA